MNASINTNKIESLVPIKLNQLTRSKLQAYFDNTWELYEILFSAIKKDETFYLNPDPLRNPLIFYLGHTAAFYVNKLVMAGLLEKGINASYEQLFAIGVDPDLPQNLEVSAYWPTVHEVRIYRKEVYKLVTSVIQDTHCDEFITDAHPLWSLFMGLEHDRIHFETSSMLIRQLPIDKLSRPIGWEYAPTFGTPPQNELIKVAGNTVTLGKPTKDTIYGWDNEYGSLCVEVKPFAAYKNLITNKEYLEFVEGGEYDNKTHWSEEGWNWKTRTKTTHPKFWVQTSAGFVYRAMFDHLPMPLDWPVEVNAHEAWAYCCWKGEEWRLLSEAEFTLIHNLEKEVDPVFEDTCNLNMCYGSPTPVGHMEKGVTQTGFNDIFGNVWDWLQDDFYPLPGFKVHPYYTDFSAPFFDEDHSMMLGGAWATTGTGASKYYRLWFRRHFFQHAGFRLAKSLS